MVRKETLLLASTWLLVMLASNTMCASAGLDQTSQDKYDKREQGIREGLEGNQKLLGNEVKEEEINPYVFEDGDFNSAVKNEDGRVEVLQTFTKKSKLLGALEKYRLAIIEANPLTFITPAHMDADFLIFVAEGRGSITVIHGEDTTRDTYSLEPGDIFRAHAGTTFYMVNKDENEKLFVIQLLSPVNLPGHYHEFYGAGGKDPYSFFKAFSWEWLEAALNTEREMLERIFQQEQGKIIKASKQQIEALSVPGKAIRHGLSDLWPPSNASGDPINLFFKGPIRSNSYGELFEATPNDYKPLEVLELIVSFLNITQGSMAGPFHSKTAKIFIVVEGEGCFEMAIPHLSSYRRISSRLSPSTVFVVPAGHPVVVVASNDTNLKVVCFEVNAKANIRYTLAGKVNVVDKMHKEAKELAFGVPAEEVGPVFSSQDLDFFFPGPSSRQQRHGRDDA